MITVPVQEQPYQVGVKAIIINAQHEVLILKRAGKEFWDVPGGRVQAGEQPLQTLKREVFEETSIVDMQFISPREIVMTPLVITLPDGSRAGLLLWYHTAQLNVADVHVILSEEHSEYAWVPWNKAKELVSFFGAELQPEYLFCCQETSTQERSV